MLFAELTCTLGNLKFQCLYLYCAERRNSQYLGNLLCLLREGPFSISAQQREEFSVSLAFHHQFVILLLSGNERRLSDHRLTETSIQCSCVIIHFSYLFEN